MTKNIYINLPVKNIRKSKNFFAALGFRFKENLENADGACMIINDHSFVMLLREPFFQTFTSKSIISTVYNTEAIYAISAESREEVDETVTKALRAGAVPSSGFDDSGSMYKGSFQDLDGHLWEVVYTDF